MSYADIVAKREQALSDRVDRLYLAQKRSFGELLEMDYDFRQAYQEWLECFQYWSAIKD